MAKDEELKTCIDCGKMKPAEEMEVDQSGDDVCMLCLNYVLNFDVEL